MKKKSIRLFLVSIKNLKKPKASCIFEEILVLSIICSESKNEDEEIRRIY